MKAALPLAFVGLGVTSYFVDAVQPQLKAVVAPVGLEAHETHAGASLLGQFRTNMSSWLWLRTDLYLHNGVEMRVLSASELKSGEKGVGTSDKEHWDAESKLVTIIPPKERDFRGIFGDIERASNAFADMKGHAHNGPEKALPLFRLMTWLDPQFIPGWTVGANLLGRADSDAAVSHLREGMAANPGNVEIMGDLGRLYAGSKKHDYEAALRYLEPIVRQKHDLTKMTEDQADALQDAFRWTAMCYRETGRREDQVNCARYGLMFFKDDGVLKRLSSVPSLLVNPKLRAVELAPNHLESKQESDPSHDH